MKRSFSLLIAVLIISCSVISFSAASVDLTNTGKTVVPVGDWIYEKINEDTQYELDEYVGEGGVVYVPRGLGSFAVVQLGNHCFMNNTNVTSVITSSPLWVIGEYAFIDCTTLESIELNYALHTIGVGAFSGTSSLKNINLQDSIVTEIKPYTFLNSGIEQIILPETCTKIDNYAFGQCFELTKIEIPDSVTEIHEDAFKLSDKVVIYATKESYAIEYAKANGIDYVITNPDPVSVTFILGDADGDGVVTIIDATKIQRVLADLDKDTDGMITLRGDVDEDGLSILDATAIQRFIADYEVKTPIGEEVTREIEVTAEASH